MCFKMNWDEGKHQPALRASPRKSVTEHARLAIASTLLPLCPPATAAAAAQEGQVKQASVKRCNTGGCRDQRQHPPGVPKERARARATKCLLCIRSSS